MGFDPKEPRDSDGKWSAGGAGRSNVGQIAGSGKRFGRMNSTSKAKLTASAQFSTKTKPGKVGKLPALGKNSPRMIATPFKPSEPSPHAVQLQTAKSLDKDFHNARDKANKDAMHAALAKAQVPVTKYPSTKPKSGTMAKSYMRTKR